ncbi:MAG: hypothetical protein FJW22_06970 [Acidimicrobiia bacterium]|nr:hypothetical protein [Acidimicrobiia bacterium]
MPIRKTPERWQKTTLERHAYFYPRVDHASGTPVPGHARAAEKGIPCLFRRVFHDPDGYQSNGEFDFVTYFECDDESLPVFDQVLMSRRDLQQNPEWPYVEEGPMWRGRRVLRW